MFEIINYLALISRGGGGGTSPPQPRETPEEFQQRYDEAYNNLVNAKRITDRNITNMFSKPQVKRLLDVMLDENIHYVGHDQKNILFEERTLLPDGTENVTEINIAITSFKQIDKKNSQLKLEDLMEAYHNIPLYQRQMPTAVNFGNVYGATDKRWDGGFYMPGHKTVNLTASLFTNKWGHDSNWGKHVLYHEFVHAVDCDPSTLTDAFTSGSQLSVNFKNVMKGSWASNYAQSYHDPDSNDYRWYSESLAEAVAYTREARDRGGDNVKIPRSYVYKDEISYNEWKKENPKLAKFANDFVDCKNVNEIKTLFGELTPYYQGYS